MVTKVDLAMDLVGKLRQEQLQAVCLQKHLPSLSSSLGSGDLVSILGSSSGVSRSGAGAPPTPPLLPPPPPPRFGSHAHYWVDGEGHRAQDGGRAKSYLPKMDFLRFEGPDVHIWIDMCETYFKMYQISATFWVSATILHMYGNAAQWYQSVKLVEDVSDWAHFRYVVIHEFEGNTHREKTLALRLLTQTSTVAEYKQQIDSLVYQVRLFDPSVGGMMLVSRFVLGLKQEVRNAVLLQLPQTIQQATAVALTQEGLLLDFSPSMKRLPAKKFVPKVERLVGTETLGLKPEQAEPWKAWQLSDFRKDNGLCFFKCGEKYSSEHKCAVLGQIKAMQITEIIPDALLNAVIAEEESDQEDECHVLLNALSGAHHPRAISIESFGA